MISHLRSMLPLAFVALVWAPATLSALELSVSFCNKTPHDVDVAVGYDMVGTDETRSEGWFSFRPCGCALLFNQNVKTTEYWLYVKRKTGGLTDALTDGKGPLCVRGAAFTFRRSNVSKQECNKSGGTWVDFRRVDAKRSPHKLNFGSGAKCIE